MHWTVLVRIQDKFEEGGHWTTESLLHANLYHRVRHCVLWPCCIVRPLCCLGHPSPNGMTMVTVATGNCLQLATWRMLCSHIWNLSTVRSLSPRPPLSLSLPLLIFSLSLFFPLPHCAPSRYRQNQRTKGLASGLTRSPWTYWTHIYWQVAKMDDTVSDTERFTFKRFNNYSRCHVMRKECSGMSSLHCRTECLPTHCQLVV